MRKFFSTAAALVLSVNTFGSAVLTEKIAARLDSGGSFYQLTDLTRALEAEKRRQGSMPERFSRSGMPENMSQYLYRLADSVMISLVLAGAEGELAYGASSVPCPETGEQEQYFRNTGVLLHGKNSGKGVIWRLFGSENHDLTEDLHAVPANALLAADFEFYPAEAVPAVTAVLNRLLNNPAVNASVPEILKGMGGSWCVLAIPLENLPLPGIMAAAPDKNGAAFRLLSELTRQTPTGNMLALGSFRILHFADENMTVFYSSPECMDALSENYRLLKDTAQYKNLTHKLDFSGTGFVYTSPELPIYLRRVFFRNTDSMIPEIPESLTVFKRLDNGFEAVSNSTADLSTVEFRVNFSVMVNLLNEYVKSEYRANLRREKVMRVKCRERLALLESAVRKYQEKHNGAMPPAGALESMTALLKAGEVSPAELLCPGAGEDYPAKAGEPLKYGNISYVYFGPWEREDDENLPVLADWQFNHKDCFNVLLKNGKILSFEVEKLDSCRRLVSVLQSKFKYTEKDFRKIMSTATKLETQLLFP